MVKLTKKQKKKIEAEIERKKYFKEVKKMSFYTGGMFVALGLILGIAICLKANKMNIQFMLLGLFTSVWIGFLFILYGSDILKVLLRLISGMLFSLFLVLTFQTPLFLSLIIFISIGLLSYYSEKAIKLFGYLLSST